MKEEIKSYYRDRQIKEEDEGALREVPDLVRVCGATALVTVGVTTLVINRRNSGVASTSNEVRSIDVSPRGVFAHQTTNTHVNDSFNETTIVNIDNRTGPPSYIVENLDTGATELSQRAMAYADGVNERDLSKHLNGKLDDVKGNHYERRGYCCPGSRRKTGDRRIDNACV